MNRVLVGFCLLLVFGAVAIIRFSWSEIDQESKLEQKRKGRRDLNSVSWEKHDSNVIKPSRLWISVKPFSYSLRH